MSNAANTNLAPLVDVNSIYNGCTAVDLTSSTSGQGADATTHTGTRAGAVLPASACALFNNKISRRYRGGKPRYYFPFGVSTDLSSQQTWSATAITAFQTGVANFLTAIFASPPGSTSLTGTVNVSYYLGFESVQNPITLRWRNIAKPRAAPVVDQIITRTCNPLVGSQRRRIGA